MNIDLLYDAITLIDDDLIDQAGTYQPKQKKVIHWKRWTALAACLVLVAGIGGAVRLGLFGGMGASSGGGSTGSGAGTDGSSTFMSYAGPVFPLTAADNSDGITAQRDITLDFSPWIRTWVSTEEMAAERGGSLQWYNEIYPEGGYYRSSANILVTDSYTLTNSTSEDMTATLLYPFSSSLRDLNSRQPTLSVDGIEVEPTLYAGPYSGGFEGAWGSEESDETLNLAQLNSWEGYKALLQNGAYLEKALSDLPNFRGTTAIVYEFTNAWGPEETNKIPNPTVRAMFNLDYDKTTVLSYGFHGGSFDQENGIMGLSFSIRTPNEPNYDEPCYILVLGDDVKNMETQGYVTGGWDTTQTLDNFGVTVERYEIDLDTILREIISGSYIWEESLAYGTSMEEEGAVDFETFYGLYCDYLLSYGVLAEDGGMGRYSTGRLEDLDVSSVERVCYLQTEITIPAGGSVEVTAAMTKPPSHDYYGANSANQNVNGYDMVTRLGSTLTFTGQTATLADHSQIEIIRQNFGFDPETGTTTVDLELSVEHYYLEVRRKSESIEE